MKSDGCDFQRNKKYLDRPSPPYPANKCCGQEMVGNNGKLYVSVPDNRGICKWKLAK
jgi:hypothetical protein